MHTDIAFRYLVERLFTRTRRPLPPYALATYTFLPLTEENGRILEIEYLTQSPSSAVRRVPCRLRGLWAATRSNILHALGWFRSHSGHSGCAAMGRLGSRPMVVV